MIETAFHIAQRLRAVARTGLTFAKDPYDLERYEELNALSKRLLELLLEAPLGTFKDFFIEAPEYPTPKVDVRAFVLNERSHILMVKESADGLWSLPGGWADIGYSPSEVAVKEVKEETGFDVLPDRLLALLDQTRHQHPPHPLYIYKMIIHCRLIGGELSTAFDILEAGFFPLQALPPLSEPRILGSQIRRLARMVEDNVLTPWID